jgi:kynurenine formamidase
VKNVGPRALIGVPHLESISARVQPGDSLLLRTGWSRHIADAAIYRDQLPRVGEDLARWCVERRIKLLGVEPPSVADVGSLEELTTIHQILLKGGVTIVEGLANLEQLTQERCFFVALPLKIEGCDGAPVRALAFEGDDIVAALAGALLESEKAETAEPPR